MIKIKHTTQPNKYQQKQKSPKPHQKLRAQNSLKLHWRLMPIFVSHFVRKMPRKQRVVKTSDVVSDASIRHLFLWPGFQQEQAPSVLCIILWQDLKAHSICIQNCFFPVQCKEQCQWLFATVIICNFADGKFQEKVISNSDYLQFAHFDLLFPRKVSS